MKKHSSSPGFMSMDNDAVDEIMLRVDPSSIFHCILVSKGWLQLITGHSFRRKYHATWKGHPNLLVGFFKYDVLLWRIIVSSKSPSVKLLETSKLGRIISERKSVQPIGDFISKDAGLVLSVDMQQRALYVCDFASDSPPHRLPPPQDHEYRKVHVASILSRREGFKVILARADEDLYNHVRIQTFCSWTSKWDQSTLTCSEKVKLRTSMMETGIYSDVMHMEAGMMTSGGVVYWKVYSDNNLCGIAVYDCSSMINEVSFIPEPFSMRGIRSYYGLSPQGSLWCAIWRYHWKMRKMEIWAVDEKGWKLVYRLDANSMWRKNMAALAHLLGTKPEFPFGFLSFVPGRSDSIYVGLRNKVFVCHIGTSKLEEIRCYNRKEFKELDHISRGGGEVYHPLTMEELGVWPSSPSSLHTAAGSSPLKTDRGGQSFSS